MNTTKARIGALSFCFLALHFYSSAANAGLFEESTSGTSLQTDDTKKSGWGFELNGQIRGDLFIGKTPDRVNAEVKNGYGELGLELKVTKAPYGDAFAELRVQSGYLGDEEYLGRPADAPATGLSLGEFDTRLNLREAYANLYLGPISLRAGYQIIVWGRADGINPTNNLTPIDMRVRSPEEDDRRLGNVALRATLDLAPTRLEAVWVPFYKPYYLPAVEVAEPIHFSEPDYPNLDLANGAFAGRFHLLFARFEFSLSYLYGHALFPGISLDSYNLDAPPASVVVRREAYRHHVAGLDFSTAVGDILGLRGEVAFRYPNKYQDRIHAPNPDLYYVAGADRELGPVNIILQYIGRYTFDWQEIDQVIPGLEVDMNELDRIIVEYDWIPAETKKKLVNEELQRTNRLIHSQTEETQHGASLRLEYKALHDTLSLVAFAMVNFSTWEWLVYPKIAYNITDGMTVTVGAEIYNGPKDTLFLLIEEVLSAGYAELRIGF
jgi:hypothetical protein